MRLEPRPCRTFCGLRRFCTYFWQLVAVAVDGADAFCLGMIDERPFDAVSTHLCQQLMSVSTRRRRILQVAHADIGVENGDAWDEVQ